MFGLYITIRSIFIDKETAKVFLFGKHQYLVVICQAVGSILGAKIMPTITFLKDR